MGGQAALVVVLVQLSKTEWSTQGLGDRMDPEELTQNGETAPPESSTGETESLDNLIDAGAEAPPEPTDESERPADDTGDTDLTEGDPNAPKRSAAYRIHEVIQQKAARDKALEAAGLRFNEETQAVEAIAPADDELDWETPNPTVTETDANEIYTEAFWEQTAEDMAENPTWRTIAEQLGFDPDEAVRNEWATVKNIARAQIEQATGQQQMAEAAEVSARSELSSDLKTIKADAEFSVSTKAVSAVETEVRRFKDAGYSASQIKAILPGIQAKAYYDNRADYVKAEAQRMVKGESARTVRMGAQSPEGEGFAVDGAAGLSAQQLKMAKALKMSASEYAKYAGDN